MWFSITQRLDGFQQLYALLFAKAWINIAKFKNKDGLLAVCA
jgi:hypothetical protein